MDLVNDSKLKLEEFRVKELKHLLGLLGLATHGIKKDLVARISDLLTSEHEVSSTSASTSALPEVFAKEEVAKIIDDVHRNMLEEMYGSTRDGQTSYVPRVTPDARSTPSLIQKICCPCGSSSPAENMTDMVECENPDCHVLQHKTCVLGLGAVPTHFYCEICRINRADLFWVGRRNLMHPLRLDHSEIREGRLRNIVKLNTEFEVQSEDLCLTRSEGYEIQVWCILLNDVVQFRMHWPAFTRLKVNGIPVETVNRSAYQLLDPDGRHNGTLISMHLHEGLNKISFSAYDDRIFCLGVRLVKQRTIPEVCNLIPKEQEGEPLNDATARVIRCLRGETASHENADTDLEVLFATVNLCCPISGARMKTASRFKSCVHMGCFDLESFLGLSQRTRKSKCPICLKNYAWEDIIIDPYFNQVIRTIEESGADTAEIEIKSDGSWFVPNTSRTNVITCDLSSTSRTNNSGASLGDPMIISDSE